tara:strand:+ start:2504 stop:5350 length:2847 start_codon:yes stop_codon:yes gene_type:complete
MAIETHTQTYELKNGTGSAAAFSFSFPLYDSTNELDDVFVYVWNTSTLVWDLKTVTTHYNIAGTTVTFTSGNIPASGDKNILISRSTDVKLPKADYVAGSAVKAQDLDNNQTQTLYALQELKDTKVDHRDPKILANLDMDSNKITNVASPTAATDAASKAYVDSAVSIAATVGDTAPTNPTQGDRWYDSSSGRTFVYFTDADSSQWVDASPPLDSGVGGTGGGSDQNVFKTVKVTSGGSSTDVIADGTTDTLELVAGNNVTLTPDATNDKVTINSTATASIGDANKGDVTVSNSGATWTINNDVITHDKLKDSTDTDGDRSVTTNHIRDLAITVEKLANDSVTNIKLKGESDDANDANRAVTTNHIKNAAVTNVKIADDTIAESKLDIHNAPSGTDKYLKYTSNGMEWATVAGSGSGDIEGVTAGTGLTGGGTSGTVTVNVDVGSTANKIVQLDGNAKLPTVDASNITALNAGQLTAGTIPDARFPATLPAISGANLTGITATSLPSNLKWLNVKDYGALGDGSTDDKTKIQDAIDALGTGGGTIFFPPGRYRIASSLSIGANDNGITLQGISPPVPGGDSDGGGSELFAENNIDFIQIEEADGIQIRNLGFIGGYQSGSDYVGYYDNDDQSKGTNSPNAAIYSKRGSSGGSEHLYENLYFRGISNCIQLAGVSSSVIRNVKIRQVPQNGTANIILTENGSNRVDQIRISDVIVDGSPDVADDKINNTCKGLYIKEEVVTIFVTNSSFIRTAAGIETADTWNGNFLYFQNVEAERSNDNGFRFRADNSANGNFIKLSQCFASTNTDDGIRIDNGIKGGIDIDNCNIRDNAGHGINILDGSAQNINITNPSIGGNSRSSAGSKSGIYIANNQHNIYIAGGKIGGQTTNLNDNGNQKYGIEVDGTSHDNIRVIGTNLNGNNTGSSTLSNLSSGSGNSVKFNAGDSTSVDT